MNKNMLRAIVNELCQRQQRNLIILFVIYEASKIIFQRLILFFLFDYSIASEKRCLNVFYF